AADMSARAFSIAPSVRLRRSERTSVSFLSNIVRYANHTVANSTAVGMARRRRSPSWLRISLIRLVIQSRRVGEVFPVRLEEAACLSSKHLSFHLAQRQQPAIMSCGETHLRWSRPSSNA